jgi:hypothetical protein
VESVWAAPGDGLLCCDRGNGPGFCHVAPQDDEQLKWMRVTTFGRGFSERRSKGFGRGFWSVERGVGY